MHITTGKDRSRPRQPLSILTHLLYTVCSEVRHGFDDKEEEEEEDQVHEKAEGKEDGCLVQSLRCICGLSSSQPDKEVAGEKVSKVHTLSMLDYNVLRRLCMHRSHKCIFKRFN